MSYSPIPRVENHYYKDTFVLETPLQMLNTWDVLKRPSSSRHPGHQSTVERDRGEESH